MNLISLKANNLFSFENIDINLQNRGLVLVNGWNADECTANGSGKSSLTSKAIPWVLYGKTASGLKGDSACRRGATGDCWGRIEFTDRYSARYRVTRYRSPSRSVLERFEGGWVDISSRVQAETQEKIDRLLGKDYQGFLHTDFFGQGAPNNFIYLTPIQQNSLFEFVISLDKVNGLVERTKTKRKAIIEKSSEIGSQIAGLTGRINEVNSQLVSAYSKKAEIEKAQAELSGALDRISFDEYEEELSKRIKMSEREYALNHENAKACHEQLAALKNEKAVLLAKIKEVKQQLCPTCGQGIPDQLFNDLLEAQKNVRERIVSADRLIDRFLKVKTNLLDGANVLQKQSDSLKSKYQKVLILKKQSELLDTKPLEDKLTVYKVELETLNAVKADLQEQLAMTAFWERAFNVDFRNFLIDKACPFLETKANQHLIGLGQSQIQVKCSTAKELKYGGERISFNISVSSNGAEDFDSFSGGEQQFISFAVGLAFSDLVAHTTGSDSNIMILDEPFVCLDEWSAEKFVTYIRDSIGKYKRTILLISNESSIKGLIPQRIDIIKENGVSRIS